MVYDEFKLKETPFKKIDELKEAKEGERVSVRTDIAPEDFKLIEQYFRQRDPSYNIEKKKGNVIDRSKFVKELMLNFLNNNAIDKQCFKDIFVLMLLPDSHDPDEIEDKSEIVGAIQFQEDKAYAKVLNNAFKCHNKYFKNKFNYIYNVRKFNEETYNGHLFFDEIDERVFFCVDESIQHDFVKTKMRLSEVYYELDIDNCYLAVFNLNNYLDVLKEGQYVSRHSPYLHEGVLVLLDRHNDLKICLTFDWSFYNGRIELALDVYDEHEFDTWVLPQSNNDELIEEFKNLTVSLTPEDDLKQQKQTLIDLIKFNDLRIDALKDESERSKQQIKAIDKELDELSKDNS